MARPIKETPVLKGKDAKAFAKKIAAPKPVSGAEKEKALRTYECFKSIAKFSL